MEERRVSVYIVDGHICFSHTHMVTQTGQPLTSSLRSQQKDGRGSVGMTVCGPAVSPSPTQRGAMTLQNKDRSGVEYYDR